jgi:hypothetical protein
MLYAFSTAVCVPPFLNRLPLPDAMTIGFVALRVMTAGASIGSERLKPAAVPETMNSRRLIILVFSFS